MPVGRASMPTPRKDIIVPRNFPPVVMGVTSPYPTVVSVATPHHMARHSDGMVHKTGVGSELVQAVVGGDLVGVREGRVVKYHVAEVVDLAAQLHDGLSYVDYLRGLFADDMYAEDFSAFAVEDKL